MPYPDPDNRTPGHHAGSLSTVPTLLLMALLATGCAGPACPPGPPAPPAPLGPMVTDRPDFTESASTVASGHAQLEAGYTRATGDGPDSHELGELLVRTGLSQRAELRIGIGSWRIEAPEAGTTTSGLGGSSLGVKLRLPGTALVPEGAVLLTTTVPVSSPFDDGWIPSLILAGAWTVPGVELGANLGYTHLETGSGTGEVLASVAAGLPFPGHDAAGLFLEAYGLARLGGDDPRIVFDGGLTMGLTPDAQLDFRVGRVVAGGAETVVGVGLAVRR